MGIMYCDMCGIPVDLDINREDYNFKTHLCVECESGKMEYPKIHMMPQGEDAWLQIRLGKASASNFSKVLAGGSGKTRGDYMKKLAFERIHNLPFPDKFKGNASMEHGNETESEARDLFALHQGIKIDQIGFAEYNADIGCSPDGLIGDDGLIEIKCPDTLTHMDYIRGKKTMPKSYVDQMQGQLWILKRQWCYFVSYDARYPSEPFAWQKIIRDEKKIAELEVKLGIFIEELESLVVELTKNVF